MQVSTGARKARTVLLVYVVFLIAPQGFEAATKNRAGEFNDIELRFAQRGRCPFLCDSTKKDIITSLFHRQEHTYVVSSHYTSCYKIRMFRKQSIDDEALTKS